MQGNGREKERAPVRFEGRSPYLLWLIWLVWLPLIIPTLLKLFQSHPALPRLLATLTGVALFFALYLWASRRRARQLVVSPTPSQYIDSWTWLTIVIMSVLSTALTLFGGSEWQALFFYASGYAGGSLSLRRAIPVTLAFILLALATGWLAQLPWLDLAQSAVFIPAIIFITKIVMWSITTSWELRAVREEIARLAVMTERLRIARDLHDLLGHNLSLITLKSELAGRLLIKAPERAAAEIHDIEQVARTTLQEVRDAVTSYRQPSLANELQATREILAAAGVRYTLEGDESKVGNLPTAVESVLAWTVREGVTNVIRHSRAQHCSIALRSEKQTVIVEIKNDGVCIPSASDPVENEMSSTHKGGNGLRGLAERVQALGGTFSASPCLDNEFCLTISVPLIQRVSTQRL